MKHLVLLSVAIISILTNAIAQSTTTSIGNSVIVNPVGITKISDMNFGSIAVQLNLQGEVTLSPNSTRTQTGGISLPSFTNTVSAAIFRVTGDNNSTYSIDLPNSVKLTHVNGSRKMTASAFKSFPENLGQLNNGTQNLTLGATLNVKAGQLQGVYFSDNFDIKFLLIRCNTA